MTPELRRILWRAEQSGAALLRLGQATGWRETEMGPHHAHLLDPMPWPGLALAAACAACRKPIVTPYGRRWSEHVGQTPEGACSCPRPGGVAHSPVLDLVAGEVP